MISFRKTRLQCGAFKFLAQESGIAAVEFALILPVLLVLWIGGVEVTGALSVDRRLNNLASSIGDLVARSASITNAQVDDIFAMAPSALFPYDSTGASLRITAVWVDEAGVPSVTWSRAKGGHAAYAAGAEVDSVPESLRLPESQVIMSEVMYQYRPSVGYVVTGDLDLADRMFFVPRLVQEVQLCEKADDPQTCTEPSGA